jgi:hypothetical protein
MASAGSRLWTHHAPELLRVRVESGRWGARRVRVTECARVLEAELVYDRLVRERQSVRHGARGVIDVVGLEPGQEWPVQWQLRPNPVWRLGRCSCPALGALAAARGSTCRSVTFGRNAGSAGDSPTTAAGRTTDGR